LKILNSFQLYHFFNPLSKKKIYSALEFRNKRKK